MGNEHRYPLVLWKWGGGGAGGCKPLGCSAGDTNVIFFTKFSFSMIFSHKDINLTVTFNFVQENHGQGIPKRSISLKFTFDYFFSKRKRSD